MFHSRGRQRLSTLVRPGWASVSVSATFPRARCRLAAGCGTRSLLPPIRQLTSARREHRRLLRIQSRCEGREAPAERVGFGMVGSIFEVDAFVGNSDESDTPPDPER
eukprot:654742-Rhodomonas_salina.5